MDSNKLVEKFDYRPMDRVEIGGYRHYATPVGAVPSVTTILSNTKTAAQKQALNNWKKAVGEEEAETIKNNAADLGTIMHENLEMWISGRERPGGSNYIWQQGAKMADVIIEKGLNQLDEAWGVEVPVHFESLYAGTTDCVGIHNGKPAIIDFKTSRKIKRREWIPDYLSQGSAYAMAHDRMFGTKIAKAVVMMCTWDCQYLEFVTDGDEFDFYSAEWVAKVRNYYHGIGQPLD